MTAHLDREQRGSPIRMAECHVCGDHYPRPEVTRLGRGASLRYECDECRDDLDSRARDAFDR